MSRTRSVDLLPEIFRTEANKQFLAATLDNLVQEPKFKKTQGFIGRTVGPGVNPNDKYVVELDKTRADYQLEPAVVSVTPETNEIQDVITYPGMADAITFQGGQGTRADRLYESEYYTWDPFVDYDSFINFSQYYWLPSGPDPVDVSATGIPITNDVTVTRENGVYTFSGVVGENPTLELIRGGNYTFQVAQNDKETVNYRVSNKGNSSYTIDYQENPTLDLIRGNTYVFNLTLQGIYPFWIKTAPVLGTGSAYSEGVTRNGATIGLITFTVPQDAPDILYYISQTQSNMQGVINVIDAVPGTGPGFWIQTNPGISGRIPTSPNISSRDVFGVLNNGEDLGAVIFNVPTKTAQQYYYDLEVLSDSVTPPRPIPVDLITELKFEEINNQRLDVFLEQYGGIDGIANLNNRSLIFINPLTDAVDGGWQRTTRFDPLSQDPANNGGLGSFDSTLYSQTTEIPEDQRYQLWQITYELSNGFAYLQCNRIIDIPVLNKFSIRYGNTYSNTNWFKDGSGKFQQIPLLSAVNDILYYQDGTDPEIFGEIKLLDADAQTTLDINNILGQKNYTSPNGVVFSNGLKVVFRGIVEPASYGSGSYTFECSATVDQINAITTTDTDPLYVGQQILFLSPTLGGLIPGQFYYVQSIINQFQFTVSLVLGGSAVTLSTAVGSMTATSINYREYYVAGVGTAIDLLPVDELVTPENYVVDAVDSTIIAEPGEPDYITISRNSQDRNAWSRSNRWFHVDIINATAGYNNTVAVLDNNLRAKRPVLQFRPNIRLFNMGITSKSAVDVIDFSVADAFSTIEGNTAFTVDGYQLVNGSRIIFANDTDADVRNKIWIVEFVNPSSAILTTADQIRTGLTYTIISLGNTDWNTVAGTNGISYSVGSIITAVVAGTGTGLAEFDQPIINLTLAPDGLVEIDQSTFILSGNSTKGQTYWYNGAQWALAQQKNSIQQPPLFNVYDADGISFSDQIKYPSSDFIGSKLFSYAPGETEILDPILQFPLQYLSIENVGDIVFDNNLYKDTFVYTRDNISVVLDISSGSAREYSDRVDYQRLIGWQNAVTDTKTYQQFKFIYDGTTLNLDVRVQDQTQSQVPVLKIYVGSKFQDPGKYIYTTTSNSTAITLEQDYVLGDIVEVLILSDQVSQAAFYQVPVNLENNPLNINSSNFTLGTIRQHYQSICENLPSITGSISGPNNTRDLGNIGPYGLIILQQSAPLTLAGYFLHSETYNIFNSLTYNSREYVKYKNQLLESVTQQQINFQTTAEILDLVIADITAGKVETQPFYWSDMLPNGAVYIENMYPITFITSNVFDTVQVYNFTSANYLGLSVYLNNILLTRNQEYIVATDGPRLTITQNLVIGDVITIREYSITYGSFCPNTPTKMGLYPAYRPEIITQQTSTGDQAVIIGHDGSVTKTFGDIRDDVLLEFETRIYSNLKLDGNPIPLSVVDVLPGQFRETGYSTADINNILNTEFLSYVAWNKLDYREQDYRASNEFTYNYSSSQSRLDGKNLLGAWRGIYRYYYDTQQPESTPWQMLGFSERPAWWDLTYGTVPYTNQNFVLWDDLEAGYVRDPVAPYFLPKYARPGLSRVIPTGDEGQLLSPFNNVVGTFDQSQFRKSWSLGDGSPVEASWWNSSSYPFAVMRLLALTRPAKFFALFADRDLYRFNTEFDQYLYNNRYRLDANGVEIYGNGVSKASYINWIVDYNRQSGLDSTDRLQADLANLDVRLCYRMASFSDKKFIKLFTEKSSPNSTNTGFLIPDESYNLLLYKNQPFDRASYSSVLIQRVPGGFSVFGYSTYQPYFNTLQSQATGKLQTITTAGVTVRVPTFYTGQITQVPYGYIFTDVTAVSDFLLSYGKYLEGQGLTFTNTANGFELNWNQMVSEFLYWSQQGWDENCLIALNPLALKLTVSKPFAVVDTIQAQTAENVLLDQNRKELPTRNLNIVRQGNEFTVEPLNDQTLSFIDLKYTSYEHMIVLDNTSVFGDLIYDPATGARQSRLNLTAVTTTEWNGTVDAQGFILNQNNVQEWTSVRTYAKGEIVKYKDNFWSAAAIVQPTATFNFNNWLQSDYTQIELGLLPNLANKADQLANSYNLNTANLERDADLLSYGLIGFRPRQYLASINLDDVSQVNVYRQFLNTKGTLLSAELFQQVNLGKELADYQIYENWAVQRAVYGANANRSFFELRLNRALLSASPSLIQIVGPQETSEADQAVQLGEIWRQSYKITSPNILPTTLTLPTDTALPSAGYVNLDDVDITIFNIDEPSSLEANINDIEVGTSIWVAKVNDYDWNIYRAESVPGTISHVCDNLDNTSRVIFTQQHGLTAGQQVIIRFFDSEVDGVYDVLSVSNLTTINIAFTFTGSRTVVNGIGLAFTLKTMRVAQASDVVTLPYANQISTGNLVWVDNDGTGRWVVLEKQQVFTPVSELSPQLLDSGENYGVVVKQATDRFAAFVGSPKYGFGTGTEIGAVYTYVNNFSSTYQPISPVAGGDAVLTLDAAGVRNFGSSIDVGNQAWVAAGAPGSLGSGGQSNSGYASVIYRDYASYAPGGNPYINWQLLTTPGNIAVDQGRFGAALTVSANENWLYVGEPELNQVYAYQRIEYVTQSVTARGDGVTTAYSISNTIQISTATQLEVSIDGILQTLNIDYTIDPGFTTVTFTTAPGTGSFVEILRPTQTQLDFGEYYSVTATGGGGTGALFTVTRTRGTVTVGIQNGGNGYANLSTLTILATSFDGGTVPANNITFTITVAAGKIIGLTGVTYTPPALQSVFSLNEYFFTVNTIDSFTVIVNDTIQRPRIDYSFNSITKDLTFINNPSAGAVVIVRAQSYFNYVGAIPTAGLGLQAGDQFGATLSCTTDGRQVLIGTPNRTVSNEIEAGCVYVFDRNVQHFVYTPTSTPTFALAGTSLTPLAVLVNGQYLVNQDVSIAGAANTYSVSGSTVTINQTLNVGDSIEIETDQFRLLQQVVQDEPAQYSNYGQAVDLCVYNCSLYTGAPNSSIQTIKGGVVERQVNQSRVYGAITSTVVNPTLVPGDTLRVNNVDCTVPASPNNNIAGLAQAINVAAPNATATVTGAGYLTITVTNFDASVPGNRLQVAPGTVGSAFSSLGFEPFAYTQTIVSPYPVEFAGFGASLSIDNTATTLIVGAPRGTMYLVTIFDDGTTDFDANATTFFTTILQSGAVYSYNLLSAADGTVANPDKLVFGDQITITDLAYLDQLGTSVDYLSGSLWIGAPGSDIGDSSSANYGQAFVWQNSKQTASWLPRHVQQATVDVRLLNSVFLYDRITSATTEFLDFFNPLQGKILGAAQQNIDYIGAVDPASYNAGPVNVRGSTWSATHVGEIWWDISTVRFVDPNQDSIVYAARRWGQIFPGARVDIYQWIASTVPPAEYPGPGTPSSLVSYSINTVLSDDGTFDTQYFYWVRGLTTVATQKKKTLSANSISNYIADPRSTGIAYLAPIDASTVALYNCETLIEAQDTILNIEFDQQLNSDNVHVEYELIPQDRANGFLSDSLYKKLQDSFCGVDGFGNLVPDPILSPAERYGVQFRPRQSMFVDRFAALKNYIVRANTILSQYPVSENRTFNLLNSGEPELPATETVNGTTVTNWNLRVATLEILSFQNIYAVPMGYRYLVVSDTSNRGLWTIYQVAPNPTILDSFTSTGSSISGNTLNIGVLTSGTITPGQLVTGLGIEGTVLIVTNLTGGSSSGSVWVIDKILSAGPTNIVGTAPRELMLYRVQNYSTPDYWSYIDWYQPGYNSSIKPVAEVPNFSALTTLTVPVGSSVRVKANAQGKFEIYLRTDLRFERVGLQDGTIEISAEIYDYTLGRVGFDVEVFDAQYFDQEPVIETRKIIQAINEELFIGDLEIERNRELSLMFNYVLSEFPAPEWVIKTSLIDVDHKIRELLPFQNYSADNQEFVVDYIQEVKPYHVQVREFNLQYFGNDQFVGDLTDFDLPAYYDTSLDVPQFVSPVLTPYAIATSDVSNVLSNVSPDSQLWQQWPYTQWFSNYLLTLVSVRVARQGSGYTTAPQITFSGGGAMIQATAVAIINSVGQVVAINVTSAGGGYRSTPTITIAGGNGTGADAYAVLENPLVREFKTTIRYDRFQYRTTVLTWNSESTYLNGTLVRYNDQVWEANNQDGSSAVTGPTFEFENWTLVNAATYQYPGSGQSTGLTGVDRTAGLYVPGFNNPGLDLPLLVDGIDYPGVQVWGNYFTETESLDTIYQSSFSDVFLGTRPADINVDGGQFVGPYEGHAPEELVNGSEYDTMDLRVYTRPGSDWQLDGHGFQLVNVNYVYQAGSNFILSYADQVEHPVQLVVSNQTTGRVFNQDTDYFVNYDDLTIEIVAGRATSGDVINIGVYELGGGAQLYRVNYTGSDIPTGEFFVPVSSAEILTIAVFVNGEISAVPTWVPYIDAPAWNVLNAYGVNDIVENSSTYYQATQTVPPGTSIADTEYWTVYAPTLLSRVTLAAPPIAIEGIAVVVFGQNYVNADQLIRGREYTISTRANTQWTDLGAANNNVGTTFIRNNVDVGSYGTGIATTDYTWSTPQNQIAVVTPQVINVGGFQLTNEMTGTNPANLIVNVNGIRLIPPAGIEWIGDGSSVSFGLPQRLGTSFLQSSIDAATDIQVWIDSIPQTQSFGSEAGDYGVTNWDGSNIPGRQVVFTIPPMPGAKILITVSTLADYNVITNNLGPFLQISVPLTLGDILSATSWNDTSQQNLLTQVFVGPVLLGTIIDEPFDSTEFDAGFVNFAPGSFDFSVGASVAVNQFLLEGANIVGTRLWVTLNGVRLFEGQDFIVQDNELVLASGSIGLSDILAVTQSTNSVVPEATTFRIFQDMRGTQATYRITLDSTTKLTADLSAIADTIYVEDASHLTEPNLAAGRLGVITIQGERIMYRVRDLITNTVSDLRRGTAGTGASAHPAGVDVYDLGRGNVLEPQYQDYVEKDINYGDGSTTIFDAPNLTTFDFGDSSSIFVESVEVYVGGTRQYTAGPNRFGDVIPCQYPYTVVDINPVTIEFYTDNDPLEPILPPPPGVEITILQRKGTGWYGTGVKETTGFALQETDTPQARFLTDR